MSITFYPGGLFLPCQPSRGLHRRPVLDDVSQACHVGVRIIGPAPIATRHLHPHAISCEMVLAPGQLDSRSSPGRFLGHQPKNGETDGGPSQKKARVAESNIQY